MLCIKMPFWPLEVSTNKEDRIACNAVMCCSHTQLPHRYEAQGLDRSDLTDAMRTLPWGIQEMQLNPG